MNVYTLTLPFTRIPNGLSGNSRHHWRVKAKSTALVRDLVVRLAEPDIEPMNRMQVELVWVVKDHRKRDEDNMAPLFKAICDGLGSDRGVSARLVRDDSPEWMRKMHPRIEYRADETAHFEVVVTELADD